jgi:hypothetical protein
LDVKRNGALVKKLGTRKMAAMLSLKGFLAFLRLAAEGYGYNSQ